MWFIGSIPKTPRQVPGKVCLRTSLHERI